MGILKLIQKREKKPLGICIPEHQKQKIEKLAEQATNEVKGANIPKNSAAFEVEECFNIHGLTMIRGKVLRGMVTDKDKVILEGKKLRISELRVHDRKVKILGEGDYGAIFLNIEHLRLQPGTIIEIS